MPLKGSAATRVTEVDEVANHDSRGRLGRVLRVLLGMGTLALAGVAGADPSVTDPKAAVEVYDGSKVAITVLGDARVPATASVSLVDAGASKMAGETRATELVKDISIAPGTTTVIPVTVTVKTQQPGWRHVTGQLVTTLTMPPTPAVPAIPGDPATARAAVPAVPSAPARPILSAAPLTVHARNTLLTDPPYTFYVGPVVALLVTGLAWWSWWRENRSSGQRLAASNINLNESWLTNLTFISALGTGLIGQITVDGANKLLMLIILASVVALLALAPLLYRGLIHKDGTVAPATYLVASWITLTAAASALAVLYRVTPAATDTIQALGLSYDVSAVGQQIPRALVVVLGGGIAVAAFFSIRNVLLGAALKGVPPAPPRPTSLL